jgi:preprotein translocase SecE subunit
MAMSVAEQPATQKAPRSPHVQLALSSLLGAVFLLFSLWVVFGALPYLWDYLGIANEFLSSALLLIVTALVACGLWYAGYHLEKINAKHGLRAGAVLASVLIFLVAWLCLSVIGPYLEGDDHSGTVGGLIVTVPLFLGLLFGIVYLFFQPRFAAWLGRVEDRGWFHALPYKPTQGVRVRRGTVLALLVVGASGIYTLVSHQTLGYERVGGTPNNWAWPVPFVSELFGQELIIPLMYKVHVVVPLVLAVTLVWFAWRAVNWPTFADFLIATEAEMNKVSWTTRKRLVQDTIVVLVTVFLLTLFLFVIDIFWIKVLSWGYHDDRGEWHPIIGVLQFDPKEAARRQQEKTTQW